MSDEASHNQTQKPACITLILCSEIIEDVRTHTKTLVSLFNTISSPQLPAMHPRFFVMGSFVDGVGEWPITFRISGPENEEIARIDGLAVFTDPLGVLDVVFEMRMVPFTRPGVHSLDVLAGGEYIIGRRFTVQLVKGD